MPSPPDNRCHPTAADDLVASSSAPYHRPSHRSGRTAASSPRSHDLAFLPRSRTPSSPHPDLVSPHLLPIHHRPRRQDMSCVVCRRGPHHQAPSPSHAAEPLCPRPLYRTALSGLRWHQPTDSVTVSLADQLPL
ncbi:hypothetical protein GUJ93_ZPchr0013g35450 [Zizania palustris]|uniref:Uncharacterized protein n=1 Tax=Zizania palustris TaxID=103762 RepID=A0A8J5WYH2_ZIZPA|nr:hypothetical protein GUJ93_ZPchr0013g35450 [Zizania palustris]